jgi:hypothetical protein
MHLALTLITIFATWRWGDWRNWKHYQPSMFYIATGGLLYEYLTRNYTMWKFHADILYSHQIVVVVYALITMPLTILLFLSWYPSSTSWFVRIRYYVMWILFYIIAEHLLRNAGYISYENGWTFWYSLLFDLMMFPMIRLHSIKPGPALLLSVAITIMLMLWFKIPLEGPTQQ